MAATVDQYVVELIIDDTQLESTLDQLERTGVIDVKVAAGFKASTAEIKKQAEAVRQSANASAPLKKNLDDVNKSVKGLSRSFTQAFNDGVVDALNEAGVSMSQFQAALKKAGMTVDDVYNGINDALKESGVSMEEFQAAAEQSANASKSFRQELKETTLELARLKLAGEENTDQYKTLVERAGELKDTLADVNAEIKDAGSDTQGLDNLIGTVQAGVGVFTAFQGVMGLVGNDSEELQKTLLKVNSAMAVLQGLQAIQNALQKEGAITLLISNTQRKIQNAQLVVENALQSKNIVVKGLAIVAQKALNSAILANPIVLFITALVAATAAIAAYVSISRDAERQTAELNAALEQATEGFDNYATQIRQRNQQITAALEESGARQSQILQAQADSEADINQKRTEEVARLRQFLTSSRDADEESIKAANERLKQLAAERTQADIDAEERASELRKQLRKEDLDDALAAAERRVLAAGEGTREQLNAQKALIAARLALELNADGLSLVQQKKLEDQANKEKLQAEIEFQKRRLDLQSKNLQTQLINVQEGSAEEFRLRLALLQNQTKAELQNLKLSEGERSAIIKEGAENEAKLRREYNEAVVAEAIAAQQRINNAALDLLKTNDEDRLALQIDNIELAAAAEVNAAKGNASKIKEINAQRDADILAVRKQFIQDAVEYEIQLRNANDGALRRALQRTAANERVSFAGRIAAVKEFGQLEIDNVNLRGQALRKERKQGLITEKEYNLRYAELQDEKKKINEETELEITALHAEQVRQRIEIAFASAQQLSNVFATLSDNRAQLEDNRIAREREELDRLKEQGLISEREAIARAKRIDAEEKKIKQQQARREKNLAIFNAVIQTAQAVAQALPNFVLAAIVGAFGAAQVAAIAARPIPAFGRGKKNDYEGLARVGETGSELIERDGKMYVAPKETIVYLGAKDKVYNPQETKAMLSGTHRVDPTILQPVSNDAGIDYNKLAEAIAVKMQGAIKTTNFEFHKDGFLEWVEGALDQKKYFTNRYSSKR